MSTVVVGDDTGLIKVIRVSDGKIVAKYGEQGIDKGIVDLCWAGPDQQHLEDRLLCTHAAGSICLYDTVTGQLITERKGTERIVGISLLTSDIVPHQATMVQQNDSTMLITCTSTGNLTLAPFSTLWDKEAVPTTPNKSSMAASDSNNKKTVTTKIGDHITRMRHSSFPCSTLIAAGGKENLLRVYDVNLMSCVFKAKNVPHDKLNLRYPVHLTDVAFFNTNDHQIAEGTAYHQVRIYDTRVQKQPILHISMGDHPITSITVSPDDLRLIVGDGAGSLHQLDTRTLRVLGGYHGIGGSVRCNRIQATSQQLASVGLDRFLRIYDVRNRSMLHKVYLKQQLNVCLWSQKTEEEKSIVPGSAKMKDEQRAAADGLNVNDEDNGNNDLNEVEDDELWQELHQRTIRLASTDKTGQNRIKKKRKIKQEENHDETSVLPVVQVVVAKCRQADDHVKAAQPDTHVEPILSSVPPTSSAVPTTKKGQLIIGRIRQRSSRSINR